jgi:non-ribosomal peptide synthetase component E (peptide arylation enzyme)
MSVNAKKRSLRQKRMVDDAVIAYVEWREECMEVWNAYGWWASAPLEEVRRGHAAYRAALDREEAAAKVYAALMKRVGQLVETGFGYPPAPGVRFDQRA